jgi:hypothetical protein
VRSRSSDIAVDARSVGRSVVGVSKCVDVRTKSDIS